MKHLSKKIIKAFITILIFTIIFSCTSQEKTVMLKVDTNNLANLKKVTIKGNIHPLSNDSDFEMKDVDGDGIYKSTITFNTSKRYVKFKFLINGKAELQGDDDRVLWFKEQPVVGEYVFNEFNYYNNQQIKKLTYSNTQIEEDIAVLKEIIQYVHPNIYQFRDSITLQDDFKVLEEEMKSNPTLTNAYGAVSKFAAKIKCSHTFTNPWNQGPSIIKANFYQPDKIPFTFNRIGKRLFIDKNASENLALKKGLEIISINGLATAKVLTKLSDYVTSDGNNYEKKLERLTVTGEDKFSIFDIFYPIAFGSVDSFTIKLKDINTNKTIETIVKATSKTNRTKVLLERFENLDTSLKDGWNFETINKNTAKLSIKSFAVQRNEFDWKDYLDDVFKQLKAKSIKNFIVDIRGNEGGQEEVGQYILERIIQKPLKVKAMQSSVRYIEIPKEFKKYMSTWAKFPYNFKGKTQSEENGRYFLKEKYTIPEKTFKQKKSGFKGNVYLITDASNSSATHLMAMYAKQIEGVTIVGQETGGNQMGTNGSYLFFLRLPNTRLELDIPVINNVIPNGKELIDGGVKPHIMVTKKAKDFINNKDTELGAVLNLIKTK